MNVKRVVNTSFWDDDLVIEKFTAEDKYFMLYILTNRYTNQLGIYHFPVKNVAFDMGYSKDSVYGLIDRFEKFNLISFSKDSCEIAIFNYLRHSVVKGGKPVMDCLIKDEKNVKDKSLVVSVINHLSYYTIENDTINDFINYLKEKYNENENDNDNDNDSIVGTNRKHESLNDELLAYEIKEKVINLSIELPKQGDCKCEWCGNFFDSLEKHHFPIPKKNHGRETVNICHSCHKRFHDIEYHDSIGVTKKETDSLAEVIQKDIKHKHGEYKNVMLKDSEYDKLAEDFGVEMRNKCITFLDEYIEEKGYKSKSHNLAIRRWVVDAVKRKGNANTTGGIDWSKV